MSLHNYQKKNTPVIVTFKQNEGNIDWKNLDGFPNPQFGIVPIFLLQTNV